MNSKQRYRLHVLVSATEAVVFHFSIPHIVSKKTQEPPPGHISLYVKPLPPAYPSCSSLYPSHFIQISLLLSISLYFFCHHPVLPFRSSCIIYILHPPPLSFISPLSPESSSLCLSCLFSISDCSLAAVQVKHLLLQYTSWMNVGRKQEIIRVIC